MRLKRGRLPHQKRYRPACVWREMDECSTWCVELIMSSLVVMSKLRLVDKEHYQGRWHAEDGRLDTFIASSVNASAKSTMRRETQQRRAPYANITGCRVNYNLDRPDYRSKYQASPNGIPTGNVAQQYTKDNCCCVGDLPVWFKYRYRWLLPLPPIKCVSALL